MIFGIGTDLVEVARIANLWQRHGEKFAERILMPEELDRFEPERRPERYLATRFAAKEAIVKAMGTGFARGVWLRDVGVVPNALGRPQPVYSDRGLAMLDRLGAGEGHVTLTDEAGFVVAVAVLLLAGIPGPPAPSGDAPGLGRVRSADAVPGDPGRELP
jgi:holo-[acyl-carrier protein] synthase